MTLLHHLFQLWLQRVLDWGYAGVFILMALESSVVPIPSEIVIPPAAYWATQGKMNFWLVILAGTLGSWTGAALTYLGAHALGRPLLRRYGKFFLVTEARLTAAEGWLRRHATVGIFAARLLPVMRHLISIPAGLIRMPFGRFSLLTLLGSWLWCTVLAWFGAELLGDRPDLLNNPAALVEACKEKFSLLVIAVLVLLAGYIIVLKIKNGKKN